MKKMNMNQIYNLPTYQERLEAHNKKSSFVIALSLCYRYVKYFKFSFWFSLLASTLGTLFNIFAILGVSQLTEKLSQYLDPNIPEVTFDTLMINACILIVFYLLNALGNFFMNYILVSISQKISYRLRMDLFNKIQMLKLQYFDTHESGDIMSVLTNDVFNLMIFISQNFGQLMFGVTTMIGMLIIMFLVSPYLTLIMLGITTLLTMYIVFMSRKSVPAFFNQQEKLGKMNGYIEEILSGQNIVNLFKRETLTESNFQKINLSLNKESEKAQTISGLFIPFMNFLANFSVFIMTLIAILFIINKVDFGSKIFGTYINSETNNIDVVASIALINAYMLALRNFVQPINIIVGMIATLQQALAGSKRASEMFILDNEDLPEETQVVERLNGSLKIKNLNFGYIPNKLVLKNINLDVKPGETIAIVGPTGSGKTTIINLLTKFYDVTDGDIYFDNYDIKTITKSSIRNQVSIVLQDTYLFTDTIKNNIKYAKPDATDDEIKNVCKVANCDTFINQLEFGYETMLTENASELSQGQKQLVAIARAMLSTSSILILDEATSNIDTRTEKVIQDAMNKLIKTKTSFVIAHRLSTIKNADKIVVLKDGVIIEMGNHNQLIKQKGFYYQLSNSKSGKIDQEE